MNESTALATVERSTAISPVHITEEQITVIRDTICKDATPAEMQLFFYDCQRRGVHPLDKLIHFTKRKGKYTPVTSIDFFRSRAGDTGEHMGTDDAVYEYADDARPDTPTAATVTVYRFVKGEKCPFTATARMREYLPEAPNDFMWRKMPNTMLGKCAEALALRKAFPQQLGGLYTVDEMAQADNDPPPRSTGTTMTVQPGQRRAEHAQTGPAAAAATSKREGPNPIGKIRDIDEKQGAKSPYWFITLNTGFKCATWSSTLAQQARDHQAAGDVVDLVVEPAKDPKYAPGLKEIGIVSGPAQGA